MSTMDENAQDRRTIKVQLDNDEYWYYLARSFADAHRVTLTDDSWMRAGEELAQVIDNYLHPDDLPPFIGAFVPNLHVIEEACREWMREYRDNNKENDDE